MFKFFRANDDVKDHSEEQQKLMQLAKQKRLQHPRGCNQRHTTRSEPKKCG